MIEDAKKQNRNRPKPKKIDFIDVSDKKSGSSVTTSESNYENQVDETVVDKNVDKQEGGSESSSSSSSKKGGGLDDNILFIIIAVLIVLFLSGKNYLK